MSKDRNPSHELARSLGFTVPLETRDQDLIMALLDDEYADLSKDQKEVFAARVRGNLGDLGLAQCGECQHIFLSSYQASDGCCRECGALLEGCVLESERFGEPVWLKAPGLARTRDWSLADSRLGAVQFHLPEDNVSWDVLQEKQGDEAVAKRRERELKSRVEAEVQQRLAVELKRIIEEERAKAKAEAEAQFEREIAKEKERLRQEFEAQRAALEKELEEFRRKASLEAQRLEQEKEDAQQAKRDAVREADAALRKLETANDKELAAEKRRAAFERMRPAMGCLVGLRAGKDVRIPALPKQGRAADTAVYLVGTKREAVPRLFVGSTPALVNNLVQKQGAEVDLSLGSLVQIGEEVFVIEESSELGSQVPEAIHFQRADKKPGGPWSYWNEEINIGASPDCAIQVIDDDVHDTHAKVVARFGRVILEDLSAVDDPEAGVWVGMDRRPWTILEGGSQFRLGYHGPVLRAAKGEARVESVAAAKAMKPSRHKRTVLEVRDGAGVLRKKVFIFTRREVRFGKYSHDPADSSRMINEWTLVPTSKDKVDIGVKQGGLVLTRHGVDVRYDGGAPMLFNETMLNAGHPVNLERRFALSVGTIQFDGRVYRSPSSVMAHKGPPRLGMKGGHPFECVRLERATTAQSYVFLVRVLRLGSESHAPLRLEGAGVHSHHCQIMFSQGKFLMVAPKASAKVFLGDVEMETGAVYPLEIDTVIRMGELELFFREPREDDFIPEEYIDEPSSPAPSEAVAYDEADYAEAPEYPRVAPPARARVVEAPVEQETAADVAPAPVVPAPVEVSPVPVEVVPAPVEVSPKVEDTGDKARSTAVLEFRGAHDELLRQVFLVKRRTVRLGGVFSEGQATVNDLLLLAPNGEASIAREHATLRLTNSGVEVCWLDGDTVALDEESLVKGEARSLERQRFKLIFGQDLVFYGSLYKDAEPAEGLHPVRCVRLDRRGSKQSILYLVRSAVIGRAPSSSLRIRNNAVNRSHCELRVEKGCYCVAVPSSGAAITVNGEPRLPGQEHSLAFADKLGFNSVSACYREAKAEDFQIGL